MVYNELRSKKCMKKEKKQELNAFLEVKKHNGFENLYITLENGVNFQVEMSFYNSRLFYKVKKSLEK